MRFKLEPCSHPHGSHPATLAHAPDCCTADEVPKRRKDTAESSASNLHRPAKPSGLRMPEGLGGLSVEVAPEAGGDMAGGGQLSVSSLTNAPLSAILGAFGFGSVQNGALPPPSASFSSMLSPNFPPLSSVTGAAHTPLFGLSPLSMQHFVGSSATLLEEALDAPLSSHPLSHARKSPRFPLLGDGI